MKCLCRKRAERQDWMHAGAASQSNIIQEEFLLGKRKIRQDVQEEKQITHESNVVGSLFSNPNIDPQKEWETKLKEDPLFLIKKKELQVKNALIAQQMKANKIEKMRQETKN